MISAKSSQVHYLRHVFKLCNGLGIADESETGAGGNDVRDVFARLVRQVAEDGENRHAPEERRHRIHQTDDHGVPEKKADDS